MIGYNFGPEIREVERTHDRLVLEQLGANAFAIFIIALGILGVVLRPDKFALGWGSACGLLAAYFSTRSIYTADRLKRELVIDRRNLLRSRHKVYDAHLIDRITVWDTQKGSGLVIHFCSGRKRSLTRSLTFSREATEQAAFALNSFLHIHGREHVAQS